MEATVEEYPPVVSELHCVIMNYHVKCLQKLNSKFVIELG